MVLERSIQEYFIYVRYKNKEAMKEFMTSESNKPLLEGDLVEGTVITTSGITMYIDLVYTELVLFTDENS
jgi:hypothetical protein